ncbi:hypothetical protein KBY27_17410 [Ruegeria pomeroyi]|uniref:Uncharacterized protein n=1 Tax=Ruegeria pomeroyi TaxID=89184 RepID=A0A9Q3ZR99_9RHOB|nr:hypothetical protein [Ruegeria pomeroyi]MCE8539237.1 hypothetical protein [Ruegeria pomeroyi]
MTKGDIEISRHAFGQLVEMLSFLETDTLDVYERIAIMHKLTKTAFDLSAQPAS